MSLGVLSLNRRSALRALALVLAACVLAAGAEERAKIPVVGVPLIAAGPNDPVMVNLRRGLSERGYVDGQNIRIEHRFTKGRVEALPEVMAELIQMKVDVIVAGAEPIVKAAMQATTAIPIIVIGWDYDPVASRLVQSLQQPGGNVTGVYLRVLETVGKRLELSKEVLPGLTRLAVLYDSFGNRQLPQAEPAGAALGISVIPIEVNQPYDFRTALRTAKSRRAEAAVVLFSPNFYVKRQQLVDAALEQRLPTVFQEYESVRAGGLISYGPSPNDGWYRAAYFIDRILKGTRPSELPIERPDVYYLVINMKTGRALGVTIPESVRLRADEIVR